MNLSEGYDYMFRILFDYWIETGKGNVDLSDMLSGFDKRIFRDKAGNRVPSDPGAWQDWVGAVRKITQSDSITEKQAYAAMVALLREYNDNHGFDLVDVIEHFR